MNKYKVIICPECGKVQITQAKRLKCVRCRMVREFSRARYLLDFPFIQQARSALKQLSKTQHENPADLHKVYYSLKIRK